MIPGQPAGATVLVVDPNAAARAMLQLLLTQHGYVVSQADGLAAALTTFTQEAPMLVIAAEQLGSQTGLELLQTLHARQLPPGGIIVGRRSLQRAQTALRGGADEYVARPVNPNDLIAACEHALSLRVARTVEARLTARLERLQTTFVDVLQTMAMAAQGRLAAYVAHEINNPLTPILGQAELLLDDLVPTDPRRDQITAIITSVQRIRTVIQRMVEFSRPARQQRNSINLGELLYNTLQLTEQRLRANAILPHLTVPHQPVLITGNTTQITDALLHLIDNAYDASPHGGTLDLALTVERDERDARYAVITMRDTGTGIAPQHQPYIFDLFYSTKTQGGPNGTGLSLAQSVIVAHSGTLDFTTQVGQGSVFRVRLPLYTSG